MRINYVAMDGAPYSDRSHEIKVAEELARLGHEVHLVVERQPRWTDASPRPDGIASVTVAPVNDASKAIGIASLLEDADVGFASSVSGAPILAAWKTRTKRPVTTQVLDCPLWRLQWGPRMPWFEGWRAWHNALYEMDHLITNTNQTVKDLQAARKLYDEGRDTPPTDIVYYGIDTEAADAAKPLPRPDGGYPMAVGVSRLVPYKGFDLAIASLATLAEKVAYYVVGDGEDMNRLVQMDQLLYGGCSFTGGVSDESKFRIIKSSDFGLFLAFNPHIPAQFPMESVYCGKPCIVADTAINRERFLDHGVDYVNPADTREVADVVRVHLGAVRDTDTHQDVADLMEKERQWVLENRSFHSHAKGVLDVLGALHA